MKTWWSCGSSAEVLRPERLALDKENYRRCRILTFSARDVFFFSIPLGVLRQGINSSVSFALTIIDLKVVIKEFLGPVDLSEAQTLCVHKSLEVVMVGKNKNFMSRVF